MSQFSSVKSRIKTAARYLISGRVSKYFEDEYIGISFKKLVPSFDERTNPPRINIITPTLSSHSSFGGISTLIELPLRVFSSNLLPSGWRIRIICFEERPSDCDNIGLSYIAKIGIDPSLVEFHFVGIKGRPVPVGAADVFLGSLWFHFYSARPLLEFQKDLNNGIPISYVSLFQDYEASFNQWSSAFMLARAMYESDWPMVHIFNSKELASYFSDQGHPVRKQCTFEPVMNSSLRSALIQTPPSTKRKCIIFYGRPESQRNCYYLARAALEEWSETFSNSKSWEVVSVGQSYPSFTLRNGCKVNVQGKLSLDEYSEQLRRAAVGLSLMASPHPSYPPLEMAHFGALTVTNSFPSKNLSNWHENIISVDLCDPSHLAAALTEACKRFEHDAECGLRGKSLKSGYLQNYDTKLLSACAKLIEECVTPT